MFPKTLQHPCVPHTHAPTGNLMNSILNQHLIVEPIFLYRAQVTLLYFLSAYEHLQSALWNTSQAQHVQNHSLSLNIQDDSKVSEHLQRVTIPSDFSLWSQIESSVFTPLPPLSLEEMKAALGLPFAVSTTDSKNATFHRCPLTQEVHAEHF